MKINSLKLVAALLLTALMAGGCSGIGGQSDQAGSGMAKDSAAGQAQDAAGGQKQGSASDPAQSPVSGFAQSPASGVSQDLTSAAAYTAANEILSYKPVAADKTIITVGKYMAFDETPLETALEQQFPELDIVWMESHVGADPIAYMSIQSQSGRLPDIMFSNRRAPENDFLYDLSAEDFVSRYNLSALNAMDMGGSLYQIPIANTLSGIAYNKTLFDEHGWKAPDSLEEFYSLCDEISAAGIRPFAPCLKYYSPLESMGLGLSFDEVLASLEKQTRYNAFAQGDASCQGLLEPMFITMKSLYEKGIIREEDFSSSATKVRYKLYEGEYAMMPTNLDILTLYNEEQPDCELDFIGYPTKTPGQRWMHMVSGIKMSVAKTSMEDSGRKKVIQELLDYLSTDEGQAVLFQSFSGISSLSSYQQQSTSVYPDVQLCIAGGRVFFADYFGSNADIPVIRDWIVGDAPVEEMIQNADGFEPINEFKQLEEPPIGTAGEDFTILETSIYNADVMREATGAEIALILNNYYYKGNLGQIFEGDIGYPARFVLKGVSDKDYLTVYEITGRNLKEAMEHPVINGKEVNAMYAPSGLKMEYAPWAKQDANVKMLSLADGGELADDAVYTVAAWAGSIDEKYISGVVRQYDDLGGNQKLMADAIKKAGTVTPVRDGRVTLDWTGV